jgi:hypothetical protein
VIENNLNKDLIISMSIKQDLGNPKRRKGKRDTPLFLLIQMKGFLSEKIAQMVLQEVFMFLEFRKTVLLRGV